MNLFEGKYIIWVKVLRPVIVQKVSSGFNLWHDKQE